MFGQNMFGPVLVYDEAMCLLLKLHCVEVEMAFVGGSRLDLIHVMTSVGNSLANTVWEFNCKGRLKPSPTSPRYETPTQASI